MDIPTHLTDFSQQLTWLNTILEQEIQAILPLAGDAGLRKYYRVTLTPHQIKPQANPNPDQQSYIFVDSSADPLSFKAYVAQTNHLTSYQLPIPTIIASDAQHCYALIEDFGDQLLVTQQPFAKSAYIDALDILSKFHRCAPKAYGRYQKLDQELLVNELLDFQTWYLEQYLQHKLSVPTKKQLKMNFQWLCEKIHAQPYIFIHRDYHSKNILILENTVAKLGIIDFQDAMSGPITYDLASLLKDCYITPLAPNVVQELVSYYFQQQQNTTHNLMVNINQAEFYDWFELTSIQRSLKAICTFARKFIRDNNASYLPYIANALHNSLLSIKRYPELNFLEKLLQTIHQPIS